MSEQKQLRDQVKDLLNDDHLEDAEFQDIQQLLTGTSKARKPPYWNILIGLAASVLLAFGSWLYVVHPEVQEQRSIYLRISDEVLANHINIHPLDLESSSIEMVQQAFDRLDFVPISTKMVEGKPLTLLGARYCTLQGVIATQLMYSNSTGELVTYYQAAYDPQRFGRLPHLEEGQEPVTLIRNGIEIQMWLEQGVVVSQARQVT